ncbi:MAG: hypothetical protein U0W24_13580 [Bacteroidales bacterium]
MRNRIIGRSLVLFVLISIFFNSFSQETIKTITAFKKKANYTFSPEWQYLSTDLYLLNAQRFSDLLNDIYRINTGGKKRKLTDESLVSLFIKAKVQNLKFFGGDMIYPIYNFKINESETGTSIETGNVEVVRLIDNLPLNESNEVIDAEISGEAITKKNSDDFLKVIGVQLQNISRYSKPNTGIFDLIGELGRFIESKTNGKQYKFSSTIRLYEGQDFNKRLHSVNVFVFVPSSAAKVNILADNLSNYLDTATNPEIDQNKLNQLVNFKKYPMVIIANYKSRYNSQPIIGDQINFDYLDQRKLKIQSAFQNELINKTTYNQELKLIEFLTVFADLKLNINNYNLNLKNNITNDYSKNIFVILKIYRDLLKVKKSRKVEYAGNTEFEQEYLPKYESVISNAGLYLNEQNALTNLKEVGDLLEKEKQSKSGDIRENNLRILYSIKIPEDEISSEQAKDLNNNILQIENELFAQVFSPLISKINSLSTDEAGEKEKIKLESQYGNTYCNKCKVELTTAFNSYNIKFQNAQRAVNVQENEKLKSKAISIMFELMKKKNCIDQNFAVMQKDSGNASYNELVQIEIQKLEKTLDETKQLIKSDIKEMNIQQLNEQNFMLEAYIKKLEEGFAGFCNTIKGICDCKN